MAQLVRAPPCHGGGRGFESHPGRFSDKLKIEMRGLSSAGRASALQAEGHRFEPYRPISFADVAQLAEQLICNQQVIGSSPIIGLGESQFHMDGFPSGQRGQTVNLLRHASVVRIHLHPFKISIDILILIVYNRNVNIDAGWSSLEARRAHNPKVVGSNPAPAIFYVFFILL